MNVDPETGAGPLLLTAVGDCLLGRRISEIQDPDFLALIDLLRGSHVAWGNCEVVLTDPQTVFRMPKINDGHAWCEPRGADELHLLGLRLMGTANNHTMDFGVRGLGSTLGNLDRVGIVHAGAGFDLEQAARPAYLDTAAGRVALVNCASSFLDYYAASPPEPVHKGRPGLNPIHFQYVVQVEPPLFESLRQAQARIHDLLGWDEYADILKRMAAARPAGSALFFETVIQAGETVDLLSLPRPADVSRVLKAIESARPKARLVIASIHSHEARHRLEEPDPFLPSFARGCLDAGADLFLAAGPHVLRGIEIYRGKPIFYSLGNFCSCFKIPEHPPAGPRETVSQRRGRFWESFVPRITFAEGGEAADIELHPITLSGDGPAELHGVPRLARGQEARAILSRLAELSQAYGTCIDLEGEIAKVRLR